MRQPEDKRHLVDCSGIDVGGPDRHRDLGGRSVEQRERHRLVDDIAEIQGVLGESRTVHAIDGPGSSGLRWPRQCRRGGCHSAVGARERERPLRRHRGSVDSLAKTDGRPRRLIIVAVEQRLDLTLTAPGGKVPASPMAISRSDD